MTLFSRLIVLFILVCLLAFPAAAQEEIVYQPVDGSFSASFPAGWTDASTDRYGQFTRAGVTAYWFVVEAAEVESAVADVAAQLGITLSDAPQATLVPAPNGTWTQLLYVNADGSADAIIGQAVAGRTYLLLMRADSVAALQSINSDLTVMLTSFELSNKTVLTPADAQRLTADQLADLDAYIRSALEQFQIPGAVVAVVQNGEVVLQQPYGVADLSTAAPITDDTTFMIGSVTKSMTTMMVASLIDDGLLTWDTPVSEIAPEFALSDADVTAQLTVRDFFNMATGFPASATPMMIEHMTPQEVMAHMQDVPLTTPYRESFQYSNQMFAAGGYYTSRLATGSDANDWNAYTEQLTARVLAPIGMTHSHVDFESGLASNYAQPHAYDRVNNVWAPVDIDHERFVSSVYPAGAVWSTIDDMAAYLMTQMNDGVAPDGTRVASAAALGETRQPQVAANGVGSYALGWMLTNFNGLTEVEHGGANVGFSSSVAFLPEADLGVVVLTNRENASAFAQAVRYRAYELAFGLEHTFDTLFSEIDTQQAEAQTQMAALWTLPEVPAADVADYLGAYSNGVTVTDMDGTAFVSGDFGSYALRQMPDGSTILPAAAYPFSVTFGNDTLTFSLPNEMIPMTVTRQ